MKVQLVSCDAARPDRYKIAKKLEEIADDTDNSLARELTDVLLEGTPIEIEISFNPHSGLQALRKLEIDYEILD